MNKLLTFGTLLLGCCLAAAAQSSGYSNPSASPSPQSSYRDQYGFSDSAMQSSNQKTSVRGCLSKSSDGTFLLSDVHGNSFQLTGDASRMGQFVGQQVRVDGFGVGESSPGAMAAPSSGLFQKISVTKIDKIADTCNSGNWQGGSNR